MGIFSKDKHYFEIENIPDLTGKVAIVTGANSGLGRANAEELAKKGAHVFLACRNEAKTLPVIEKIKKLSGNDKVEFLPLDLSSLQSVKKSAEIFKSRNLPLHILINNAAISRYDDPLSPDGIEIQFAVSHVGHYYFTILLLSTLEASAPSRVVTVSSSFHRFSPSDLGLDNVNNVNRLVAYCRAKLANLVFSTELSRRLEAKGVKNVYSNAAHPGLVRTEMNGGLLWYMGIEAQKGALSQLFLATSPEVEMNDIRGKYYIPFGVPQIPSDDARDPKLGAKLWQFTEDLLKEKVPGYQGAGL